MIDENNLSFDENKNFILLSENNDFEDNLDDDNENPVEDDDFGLFDARVPTDYSK